MIKLREFRKNSGISQSQLATMLDVCQSTVAMWESGTNTPRIETLVKIAEVLECDISDLLGVGNARNVKED